MALPAFGIGAVVRVRSDQSRRNHFRNLGLAVLLGQQPDEPGRFSGNGSGAEKQWANSLMWSPQFRCLGTRWLGVDEFRRRSVDKIGKKGKLAQIPQESQRQEADSFGKGKLAGGTIMRGTAKHGRMAGGRRMDALREFLEDIKRQQHADGNFLGLLHLLIGRTIAKDDGSVISTGTTWRELAGLFKKLRWNKDAVRELGLEPSDLPLRDRQRYWYTAIARAKVDSEEATEAGERLADTLRDLGFQVGPPPGG